MAGITVKACTSLPRTSARSCPHKWITRIRLHFPGSSPFPVRPGSTASRIISVNTRAPRFTHSRASCSRQNGKLSRICTGNPCPDRLDWVYSDSGSERDRACIGHLRGDFGRGGDEFWTGWFDHQPNLKSKAFRDELQDVVNGLRRENGLLSSFSVMSKKCRDGLPGEESFSFQGQTANHLYCLRCIPRRGDYNFYLYAYDKNILREQARKQSPQAQEMTPKKPHKTRKNEMER